MKGLTVELVILNEDTSVYRQSLHDQITSLIASGIEAQMLDKPGGIFVRRLEQVSNDDRVLLQSVARIVFDDENGTLDGATRAASGHRTRCHRSSRPTRAAIVEPSSAAAAARSDFPQRPAAASPATDTNMSSPCSRVR